jgi:uncharacterized cupin superfamily protein
MRAFNVFRAETTISPRAREGYRAGAAEFGPDIGASLMGGTVWDLAPGERNARYHYDHADEEWLLVLEGRPTVRHPGGQDELQPGDVVCFPAGPDGAHSVANLTLEPVRMVMLSTQNVPTVVVYPDEGQLLVYTGHDEDNLLVPRSAGEHLS